MTDLNALSGTYTLDPNHSEVGFAARHAMVTKVRGAFNDVQGTASTGANLADASIDVTIQAASIDTGNDDRDAHLRSADFFDVENYPTIRFTSTGISAAAADVLRVEGDLTIKDATRPVAIDFEYLGTATDPFGNERAGLSGEVVVNRKDFGLVWNAALETGGVLVSENVTLAFEVSAIKAVEGAEGASDEVAPEAEAAAASEEPVAEVPAAEPVAQRVAADEPVTSGVVGWLKNLFASSNR